MASSMKCVRAFPYGAFKTQRFDMFAADSVRTFEMQKQIAGFEALKQLLNPIALRTPAPHLPHGESQMPHVWDRFVFQLNPGQEAHFASASRSVDVCFPDTMLLFSTCSTSSRHKRPYCPYCGTTSFVHNTTYDCMAAFVPLAPVGSIFPQLHPSCREAIVREMQLLEAQRRSGSFDFIHSAH